MNVQNTSANPARSGDIYQFNIDSFWEGTWKNGILPQNNSDKSDPIVTITRKEYLQLSHFIPKSGCVCQDQKSHEALYKTLLARRFVKFGVTGIKTLYLILCIEGAFGEKYEKITTHAEIRKLIGGRADCSEVSENFWDACYLRIKTEDVSNRPPLKGFTDKEKEVWRAFTRKASISCNRNKYKINNDRK